LKNVSGFGKEIDHALERVAPIEKHLVSTRRSPRSNAGNKADGSPTDGNEAPAHAHPPSDVETFEASTPGKARTLLTCMLIQKSYDRGPHAALTDLSSIIGQPCSAASFALLRVVISWTPRRG